jgi:hypothetical protein
MRKVAGREMEPSVDLEKKPWLKSVVDIAPEALPSPPADLQRKRPLIYVYDLPPEYVSRMLQYKIHRLKCNYRLWGANNESETNGSNLYSIEYYLHETLLQSEHRTFDPDEADFFYVPAYMNCLIFPITGMTDFPWYPGPVSE